MELLVENNIIENQKKSYLMNMVYLHIYKKI